MPECSAYVLSVLLIQSILKPQHTGGKELRLYLLSSAIAQNTPAHVDQGATLSLHLLASPTGAILFSGAICKMLCLEAGDWGSTSHSSGCIHKYWELQSCAGLDRYKNMSWAHLPVSQCDRNLFLERHWSLLCLKLEKTQAHRTHNPCPAHTSAGPALS